MEVGCFLKPNFEEKCYFKKKSYAGVKRFSLVFHAFCSQKIVILPTVEYFDPSRHRYSLRVALVTHT
jgi:hypothetical protein